MTEIVAAHLERVASELARDLEKRGFLSSETFRAEVEPILAAALAACAREERLQEANAAYWSWKLSHEDFGANQQKRLDELRKDG